MSNEHKNFEDRLNDRIQNEALPYEEGAWESFQDYANSSQEQSEENEEKDNESKATRFRKWFLPFVMLLGMVSFLGLWQLNKSEPMSNDLSSYNESTSSEQNIEKLEPQSSASKDLTTEEIEQIPSQFEQESKGDSENSQERISGSDVDETNTKVSNLALNEVGHREGNPDQKVRLDSKTSAEIGVSKSVTAAGSSLSSRSNEKFEENSINKKTQQKARVEKGPIHVITKDNSMLNRFLKPEQNTSRSDQELDLEDRRGGDENAGNANVLLDRQFEIAAIGRISEGITVPIDLDFDLSPIIEPVSYAKNEFYFGGGFTNRFSEFKLQSGFGDQSFEPTYYSIGYNRKLSPQWSLGIELGIYHIQAIPFSRRLRDYHQISNRFEYIDGIMSHAYSNYVGVPITLKYNPLNSKIGLYGGLNIGYSYSHNSRFENEFQGDNSVVENLRVFHTGSEYIAKRDLGVVAGATINIWKGLELEGRAVFGMRDISENYYWGEGKNYTTHYRLGLNYRFKTM